MKGLFKFASVALALVAFASCSSDDLFHKGENAQQNKGILVEVEDMIDATTTRASYTPTGKTGTLNWNTGDQIRVSDGTMVKYDIYKYDGESAFVFDVATTGRSAAYVAEPKYAVYPNTTMLWDNAKMQAWGQFNIASSYTWGEDTETDGAYYAELPLWGTAEADATYGVKTSLKYLSGILRINVDNLPNNADHIKVTGWKNLAGTEEAPMSGSFKAVFATDDVLNEEATLEPLGGNNNYITVDVSSASKAKSVIFVPLIAQTYGLLEIQYSKDGGSSWTDMKVVESLTVERRKFYNLTFNSFKFAGDDPAAISAVLEEKKADSEINIQTANATVVSSTNNTITIPETSANITLTLNNLTTTDASALNIVAAKDYAGTLVINVTNAPTISNIMINLPKANVVFNDCQNMAAVSLGADNAPDNAASGMVAKTLTINAQTKLNAIYANAELGLGNSDGADLKLVKGSQVGTIEFEKNYKADNIEICGTVTNALDMTTWKDRNGNDIACTATIGNGASIPALTITGDVTVTGGTITGALRTNGNVTVKGVTGGSGANATTKGTVGSIAPYTNPSSNVTTTITLENQGTVTGDITPTAKHFFTLEVKDQASVGGTATVNSLTIAGTTANVANAIVNGNATITNTAEAEAVTGTITMNCSAARTLTLNGGYVNTITQSGSKNLTIQHGTAANYTAIASITGTAAKIIIDTNTKSVWNGKKIGVVPSGANATVTAAQNALKAKYATGKTKIYTANQLATSDAAAELWSNIDLNNQPWNGPALAGDFAGQDMNPTVSGNQLPTIENVKLTAAASNSTNNINGVGLFATATANATLSNFTLKNVTSNITEANGKNVTSVGALIGDAGAKDITVSSVTVNNAEVGATIADNIGGLIGNTTGAIELNKVNVSGLTLNGQFYVGGIVGKTTGAITINGANTTTVDVTAINVPASFNAEPDIKTLDANQTQYGTIGMIAGQSAAAVSDASSKLTVNDLITGNRQRLGYKMCYKDPGANVKYYYGVRGDDHTNIHVWVGRITGATVDDITTIKAFVDGWKTQSANAFMVKHDIYDSCDE